MIVVRVASVLLVVSIIACGQVSTSNVGESHIGKSGKDISPVTQAILEILLKSLPTLTEQSRESNLGSPYAFASEQDELVMVNVTDSSRLKTTLTRADMETYIVAVDYDPVDNFVYWTSSVDLKRMKRDGTEVDLMYSSSGIDGIAVDWVARNIYWTDDNLGRISVSRLDGSYRKTLIGDNVDGPRGIAVDPKKGRLYWTEWRSNPRIASAALDGSDVTTLVNDSIQWPNAIAVDFYRGLVYFGDAKYERIEVINMDGTGRKVITDQVVGHVFGLSYLGGYLYWTDWTTDSAVRAPVDNPSDRTVLAVTSKRWFGIKASYLKPIKITNPCGDNNGGCSHLCFYTGVGVTCGYPDEDEIDSNTTT